MVLPGPRWFDSTDSGRPDKLDGMLGPRAEFPCSVSKSTLAYPLISRTVAAKLTLRRGITAFSGSIVALLLVGCDAATLIAVNSCSGLVAVVITTPRTVVRVGETITLDANFASSDCVSSGIITHNWRWSSSDASIARIDSLSGVVEGVGTGQVVIEVRRPQSSEVMGSTGLTVVAN
jgi:uncharacterized protein YjdB